MTAHERFLEHRSVALLVSRDYRFPGADVDDVRQEALIALWDACRSWDPERGPFEPFARLVVRSRLMSVLRAHLRVKHEVLTRAEREYMVAADAGVESTLESVLGLRELLEQLPSLTEGERDALRRIVNGDPIAGKTDDVQRYRVRRKLRERMAA